ncbi:hypothetical protein [Kordia sp.]|uniref:hypothetical protein n=1 Tax=Kordia sp. TaxID=1965332 RepID=UPI003D2D0404
MKTTHQLHVNSIPIETYQEDTNDFHRGLLTSRYKQQIQSGFDKLTGRSLFGLKQRVKTNQYQLTSVTGTILKISVFVIAYVIAFV